MAELFDLDHVNKVFIRKSAFSLSVSLPILPHGCFSISPSLSCLLYTPFPHSAGLLEITTPPLTYRAENDSF